MPNINFNATQPYGSNACGAYALTAALRAIPSVANVNYPVTLYHSTPRTRILTPSIVIDGTEPDHVLASKIYRITGDLEILGTLATGMTVTYEDGPNLENSPSSIAYVARQFGLTVTVNTIADAATATAAALNGGPAATPCQQIASGLLSTFTDEVRRCMLSATVNAPGGNGAITGVNYADPQQDEVHLLCVVRNDNMHWLTRGANGFYDPGTGNIDNTWTITSGGAMNGGNYLFTGIWIVLK